MIELYGSFNQNIDLSANNIRKFIDQELDQLDQETKKENSLYLEHESYLGRLKERLAEKCSAQWKIMKVADEKYYVPSDPVVLIAGKRDIWWANDHWAQPFAKTV